MSLPWSLATRIGILSSTAFLLLKLDSYLYNKARVPTVTAGARGMGTGLFALIYGPIPGLITGLLLYYFNASKSTKLCSFVIPPLLQVPFIMFKKPTEEEDMIRGAGMAFGFCSFVVYLLTLPY